MTSKEGEKPKLNLKSVLGEITASPEPSPLANKNIPKGARIIRLGTKRPESMGTIIGAQPAAKKINLAKPPVLRSMASKPLTYNDRVEWSVSDDGSEIAVFHSSRYPNHMFKFFVSQRANGDQYAYCMQCLDVNQRRTDLQQPLLSQPTIQIINKKWMEHPDFPKESHICMGNLDKSAKTAVPKGSTDPSQLKVIRLKTAASTASTTTSSNNNSTTPSTVTTVAKSSSEATSSKPSLPTPQQVSAPFRPGGLATLPNCNRQRFLINNYKLRFSVDAMKILRDTPGGPFIIEEMLAANGDANSVPNRVRLSLVRIMTEYLMQNCMRPGFPTTNERITYTQMFLAQLPVTFDVLPFSRPKGFIDKRIKRLRHSLSSRRRTNGNVSMPLIFAAQQTALQQRMGSSSKARSTTSSKSEEDEDYADDDSMEGDEDEQGEETMDDSTVNGDLGDEDDEEDMDVEGSTNNLLLNVIEDQILNEQAQQQEKEEKKEETVKIKQEKTDEDENSNDNDVVVEAVKPSTSKALSKISTIQTDKNGKPRKFIVIRTNAGAKDQTEQQIPPLPLQLPNNAPKYSIRAPAPVHSRDFTNRRNQLAQLKKMAPEQYPSRFMDRFPRVFETNKAIHEEFSEICPQVKTNQPGNFVASWKAFWMRRVIRYVKTLNIDEVWDLDDDASDDAVSRHAFDQLLFVFMQKQREYFRDHLWKIVMKCSTLEDMNQLFDKSSAVEHPIIVELTRGLLSQYFIVVDKQIIPVDGSFTDALQLLMELYQIFGMEYPWEYIRWFQFFEYVYGIRPPTTVENRKLFDTLRAIPVRTL